MTKENPNIFRAYDVRGVYGKDITEKTAELIGKAFGTYIGEGKRVVVSRDVRSSGEKLKKNLILALASVGCDVIDIGVVTTPMMYFAVTKLGLDGGISITASHNPAEWNGFKMSRGHGLLCSEGMGMEEIKDIFLNEKFRVTSRIGEISTADILSDYNEFVISKIKTPRKLKIVLDPGNGTACKIAEDIFRKAGHEVSVINGHPDGTFPSRPSDPIEENVRKLKEEVVQQKADIGIAFDGDVDRLAFVDNLGRYVWSGNITIPIFSEYYLKKSNGSKIVYDVCCSSYVDEMIKKIGGISIVSKVGHSFVMNKMISEGAVFGGEYSNHLYFSEIFGFDDAIFAGLKMAEIIASSNRSLAEIVDSIQKYPASKVEEIRCDDKKKFEIVSSVEKRLRESGYRIINIDGVKAFNEKNDWVLIRASNTMPVIKVNSEAKTEKNVKELLNLGINLVMEEIKNENSNN